MRVFLSCLVCRIVTFVLHKLGRGATSMPGKVALKVKRNVLKDLSKNTKVIVVTGTNGKTTSCRILEEGLKKAGKSYFINKSGANLITGVTASFIMNSTVTGKCKKDYAIIECDENAFKEVSRYIHCDVILVTNVFRDQLDRYGEIDITMNILKEVMQSAPKMKVIVNGDDALSAYLAMESGNPYVTYGISEKVVDDKDSHEIREGRFCKKCGAPLKYNFYHYSQLGDYACTGCDFKRPAIEYDASDVAVSDHLAFTVDGRRLEANYKGFYNVYNILAAYAAGRTGGLGLEHFQDMLTDFNPENGRMEQFRIKGTGVTLNLAKNPAGFNQNISAVMQDESMKDVIIVINDNAQDGTDVSWLWDVDFDRFKGANVNSITVSGIRCQDMRLRMKYVDIPSMLEADVEKAIRERVEDGCGNLYVLVNYTALFSTRNVLKKMEEER